MTFATKHNGGRSQVNLNYLQTGGEYPFINCLKTAQEWTNVTGGAISDPTYLDSDGYPTSLPNGTIYTVFYIPTQAERPGDWVVTWTGNGTVGIGVQGAGSLAFVSGSLTSSGGSGSYRFTPSAGVIELQFAISTVGSPRITNVKIFHFDDTAAVAAGDVFGVKLKERLTSANFGVIRFLNWQNNNTSNVSETAEQKPESYVFYQGTEFRSALWCGGGTTLTGKAYKVAAPSGFATLVDKAKVQVVIGQESPVASIVATFTNASTTINVPLHNMLVNEKFTLDSDSGQLPAPYAKQYTYYYVKTVIDANNITASATPGGVVITASAIPATTIRLSPASLTFEVGTTGPRTMLGTNGAPMTSGGNLYPKAGWTATFIYDATLDSWIRYGGDLAYNHRGLDAGVPVSLCLRLCAEVGADPHINSPFLSLTPMTSYTTDMATSVKNTYNGDSTKAAPWMMPVFEGPNELWNTFGGFLQTGYATMLGIALNFPAGLHDVFGMWMSKIGQDVNKVYGNISVKGNRFYKVAGGVQSAGNGDSGFNPRFNCAGWIAAGAPTQTGYTISAASGWVTTGLIANYFNPAFQGTQTETDLNTAYVAETDPVKKQALLDVYSDSSNAPGQVALYRTFWDNWKTFFKNLGIFEMRCYEGGCSPDYGSNNSIRAAARNGTRMGGYEIAYYYAFTSLTDATFTAEYPSQYLIGDFPPTASYAWSALSGSVYSVDNEKWLAIVRYNAAKRAPSLRMRIHS